MHSTHRIPEMSDRFVRGVDDGGRELIRQVKNFGSDASWTSDDTKKAILASAIPGAILAAACAAFLNDKDMAEWWKGAKKPTWAPQDPRVYAVMDVSTMAPLGYASYLVYKHGGGFNYSDTKLALGLYGASMVLALTTVPLMTRRNYACLLRNCVLLNLTAIGTAYTFYKIDRNAGMMVAPYAIWTTFYSVLTYFMSKHNTSEASRRSSL